MKGGINAYAYVGGNPISLIDPLGLATVYIWDYQGKDTAWGHASMTLNDGTHISWWPSGEGRDRSKFNENLYAVPARDPQTFADDVRFEGRKPDHVINVSGLDEEAMKACGLLSKEKTIGAL